MSKKILIAGLVGAMGLASSAMAQANGDLVFTVDDFYSNQPQGIYSLTVGQQTAPVVNQVPTLRQLFAEGGANPTRIQGITRDAAGNYYVADGILPTANPSTAKVWKVGNLFGVPTVANLSQGGQLENPIGVVYHEQSGHIIGTNNTISGGPGPGFEGIVGVNAVSGARTTMYTENAAGPLPRQDGFTYIAQSPFAASPNTFYSISVNGGVSQPNPSLDDGIASVITRYDVNPVTLATVPGVLVDMTNVVASTGGNLLTQLRGICNIPGTNSLLVTDLGTVDSAARAGGIYRVNLTAGGAFSSITPILTGLNHPESIIYNHVTGKIVFEELGTIGGGSSRIAQCNLDGSNVVTIANGIHARGFVIVPTPGSLAVLGGAGVLVARRRRR